MSFLINSLADFKLNWMRLRISDPRVISVSELSKHTTTESDLINMSCGMQDGVPCSVLSMEIENHSQVADSCHYDLHLPKSVAHE